MRSNRSRQQGVVMLVALTVLVAMSLAGVALMRSVDATSLIAGNLSFKTAGLQVADRGTQQAVGWLMSTRDADVTQLYNDVSAMGYYSSRPLPEPDWFDEQTWNAAVPVNGGIVDASGNQLFYVIHRMCSMPNSQPNANVAGTINDCPQFYPSNISNLVAGQSYSVGASRFDLASQNYYRITTRVVGPRNNITVTQTTVLM